MQAQSFGLAALVVLTIAILILAAFTMKWSYSPPKSSAPRWWRQKYGVFANQATVTGAGPILWSATQTGDYSTCMSLDSTTGTVTLPSGKFLVQYTVKLARSPYNGTDSSTVQLQQSVAGVLTNITQPAIVRAEANDGITVNVPMTPIVITGSALITVSSAQNNSIALYYTPGTNITLPAATGADANAQLVVTQVA